MPWFVCNPKLALLMCSPVKGRKDPLHVTYGVRETVSSLSHSTADHGEPSLYLASASEEVWSGDLAEKQMHLAQTDLKLSNSGFDLGTFIHTPFQVVVYDEILVSCTKDVLIVSMTLSILKWNYWAPWILLYHLEFLLATRWAPVHLTCENFSFFLTCHRRLKTLVRISWLNKWNLTPSALSPSSILDCPARKMSELEIHYRHNSITTTPGQKER